MTPAPEINVRPTNYRERLTCCYVNAHSLRNGRYACDLDGLTVYGCTAECARKSAADLLTRSNPDGSARETTEAVQS